MRVHVAFTPAEAERAPTAIVVDVLRATSTIAQALASGYRRVLCCAEVEEALELRARLGEGVLGGRAQGALRSRASTSGTRRGSSRSRCGETARPDDDERDAGDPRRRRERGDRARRQPAQPRRRGRGAARRGGDVEVVCAGLQGRFTIDDAYCAGRIAELLGGERSDAAEAAVRTRALVRRPAGGAERVREPRARPARGGHRLVRAGERARRRPAPCAHGRSGGRDRRR